MLCPFLATVKLLVSKVPDTSKNLISFPMVAEVGRVAVTAPEVVLTK